VELLGDVGHMESHFSSFGYCVSVGLCIILMLDRAWFVHNVSLAQESFWTHLMELLGDMGLVESHFSMFGEC
jgi:hypothetical protein